MNTNASQSKDKSFSIRLREATRAVHTRAEKTTFIRGFLRGTATPTAYVRLLAALHPVYQAMETECDRLAASNPVLARFRFPELYRTASLERDLTYLAGPNWQQIIPAMAQSDSYVQRIRQIAQTQPERLVGHLYTRYLGDLSGGQILARIAERSLGLRRGAGLDFYEFEQVGDLAAMKTLFRSRLDEVDLAAAGVGEAITNEAQAAFRHNIAIFEHLEGNALVSFLRNLPLPWVRAPRHIAPTWTTPAHAN